MLSTRSKFTYLRAVHLDQGVEVLLLKFGIARAIILIFKRACFYLLDLCLFKRNFKAGCLFLATLLNLKHWIGDTCLEFIRGTYCPVRLELDPHGLFIALDLMELLSVLLVRQHELFLSVSFERRVFFCIYPFLVAEELVEVDIFPFRGFVDAPRAKFVHQVPVIIRIELLKLHSWTLSNLTAFPEKFIFTHGLVRF